jgi:antitoxin CptB
MTDDAQAQSKLRARLRLQSHRRGTRELDFVLGSFADQHLDALTPAELLDYDALLQEPEPLLWDWIIGRASPPSEKSSDVLRQLMAHKIRVWK